VLFSCNFNFFITVPGFQVGWVGMRCLLGEFWLRVCSCGCGLSCSIEEDFVTWKEGLWPSLCEAFGIDSSSQENMVREYVLTEYTDLPPEKIFTGEPHRLGSYKNQKP